MLACLLLLFYSFVVALVAGIVCIGVFTKLFKSKPDSYHPVIVLLSGLCFLALLLQAFHLLHAIDGWAHIYVWVVLLILWYSTKDYHPEVEFALTSSVFITLGITLIAALVNGIARAGTGDIGDYHLQAIRWMEEFKIVPGIGNVRRQLGNNSNWFLLHAFTGMHFLGLRSVYTLNTLLLICGIWYFTPRQNDTHIVFKSVTLLYIASMAYRKYVGAVTNDYAITIYTLTFFAYLYTQQKLSAEQVLLIAFVCGSMITFKLSAIATVVIPLWLFMGHFRNKKLLKIISVVLILIFIPWMYTTYIHSGYFIYPIQHTGLLHPDWQMPAEQLQFEREINVANERVPGVDVATVLAKSFSEWFPLWVKSLDYFSLLLVIVTVGSILLQLYRLFVKRISIPPLQWMLLITVCITLMVWFTQAPAIRFVFGVMVFLAAMNAQQISEKFSLVLKPVYIHYFTSALLVVGMILFVNNISNIKWLTPDAYSGNTLITHKLKRGYVYLPEDNGQCWDAPLPCTGLLNEHLVWRGENMEAGFRIEND
jgi:hypothetical protein